MTRVQRDESDDCWSIVGEPGIVEAAAFDAKGASAIVADEFFPDVARKRATAAGVSIITPTFNASACLKVGEHMLARGETIDPLRLLPLYPRQPEAVTLWEQRHGDGGNPRSH
jgi:hypothetical protein